MTGHLRHMTSLRADHVHIAGGEMRTGPVSSLTGLGFVLGGNWNVLFRIRMWRARGCAVALAGVWGLGFEEFLGLPRYLLASMVRYEA